MNYIPLIAFIDVMLAIMLLMLCSEQYSPIKVFTYGLIVIGIACLGSWTVPCATAAAVAL